jgi:peptidoglycan/LPS O-acetylase OafA/YrhL
VGSASERRHLPALDGIRGIAVAIVVLHHLKVPGVHGGWLGVDLFFALSGFLITESVLMMGPGTRVTDFWKRRAWRLGPAMAVLLGWYLVATSWAPNPAQRFRWLAASVAQVLNIHDAASRHGPFSPHLGHLWSLSAEVQFYVVWPLVLLALVRRGARPASILAVPLALFVLTSAERTALAVAHVQWNRLYLGPDTRSTALWAGCIVGLLHFWGAFDRSPALTPLARNLAVPAFATLAALVLLPGMNFSLSRTPYLWGFTVIGLSAGALVAAGATVGGGPLRPLLESRPLEWLGRISYSVYLWHVPLIASLPRMDTPLRVIVIGPASLFAGWLSYVVVERPLLSRRSRERIFARLRPVRPPVG